MNKKILVIKVSDTVTVITAAYLKGVLYVKSVQNHSLKDKEANQVLLKTKEVRKGQGYTVIVDEPFLYFGRGAIKCRLKDQDLDGRPTLINAFNAYLHLKNQNTIAFGEDAKKIVVSDSLYDVDYINGEERYSIDWENIKNVELSMILASYAALTSFSANSTYLQDVLKKWNAKVKQGIVMPRGFKS